MPEPATRLAALRAGTIDLLGTAGDSQLRSIDEVESLGRTDPEIELWEYKYRSDNFMMLVGLHRPPWNDIRGAPGDADGTGPRDHCEHLL